MSEGRNSVQGFWGQAATHVLVYFVVGCIESVRMHVLLLTISFLYVFQAPRPLGVGGRPAGAPIVEGVPLIVGFDDAEDR